MVGSTGLWGDKYSKLINYMKYTLSVMESNNRLPDKICGCDDN